MPNRIARVATALTIVLMLAGLMAGQRPAAARVVVEEGTLSFMPLLLHQPTATFAPLSFSLQAGSPAYLANFLNNLGCNYLGFAGRAFERDGQAVIGLLVKVRSSGTDLVTVKTGSSDAIGTGGYEVFLADHPIATSDVYTIQLFSDTGTALSEQYTIPTFEDCTRNLVLVNFVQNDS